MGKYYYEKKEDPTKNAIPRSTQIIVGKWFRVLLVLSLISTVFSIINGNLKELIPSLYYLKVAVLVICQLIYNGILCLISAVNKKYKVAAIYNVLSVMGAVVLISLDGKIDFLLLIVFLMPVLIAGLYGQFVEFKTNSEVLKGIDDALSEKWSSIGDWYIIISAGFIMALFLFLISTFLGILAIVIAGIALFIVSAIRIYNIYATYNILINGPEEAVE